jgi:hypothetical protein
VPDLPREPDSSGDNSESRPGSTEESTPRWVKVFGIIGLVLVLLMLIALLNGHGPGRHMLHGHRLDGNTPAAAHTP